MALGLCVAVYGAAALAAVIVNLDWERVLTWPGPLLAALPAVFLVGFAVVLAPLSLGPVLRRAARDHIAVSPSGLAVERKGRRRSVRWQEIRDAHPIPGLRRPQLLVVFPGGTARFGSDWWEEGRALPTIVCPLGVPLVADGRERWRDPRRDPLDTHPLAVAIRERLDAAR